VKTRKAANSQESPFSPSLSLLFFFSPPSLFPPLKPLMKRFVLLEIRKEEIRRGSPPFFPFPSLFFFFPLFLREKKNMAFPPPLSPPFPSSLSPPSSPFFLHSFDGEAGKKEGKPMRAFFLFFFFGGGGGGGGGFFSPLLSFPFSSPPFCTFA